LVTLTADRKARLTSLAGVSLLHLLFGWALLLSFAPALVRSVSEPLGVFNVREVPPPPPEPAVEPPAERVRKPARAPQETRPASAPPAPARQAVAVAEPKRRIERDEAGSGSGGGSGGGGAGKAIVRAQLRGGSIVPRDYPRAANGSQGTVEARLAVSAAGAVTGCTVSRSSGNAVLDATTCRLIRQRFRFTPARDAQGNPVPSEQGWRQRWWQD
jgi:protein TonB